MHPGRLVDALVVAVMAAARGSDAADMLLTDDDGTQPGHYTLIERLSSPVATAALTTWAPRYADEHALMLVRRVMPTPLPLPLVPSDALSWMTHVLSWSSHLLGHPALSDADAEVLRCRPFYYLEQQLARGGHGEVWRAMSSTPRHGAYSFILKRISRDATGDAHYRSGLREAHFGRKLRGLPHVGRFVEAFRATTRGEAGQTLSVDGELRAADPLDGASLWLAFFDEGASLHDLMHELSAPAGERQPDGEGDAGGGGGKVRRAVNLSEAVATARAWPRGGGADEGGRTSDDALERAAPHAAEAGAPEAAASLSALGWLAAPLGVRTRGGGGGGREMQPSSACALAAATAAAKVTTAAAADANAIGAGGAQRGPDARDERTRGARASAGAPPPVRFVVPSALWRRTRTHSDGQAVLREMMRQLLAALAQLHARGIVHRDLKPSNLIVRLEPTSAEPRTTPRADDLGLRLRIIDFGSALDAEALANERLYPPGADPADGETAAYSAPEIALQDGAPIGARAPAYDLWSVGVILLELLLGSADVFTPDARTHAIIAIALGDAPPAVQRRAALAHAWGRLGILSPASRRGASDAEREAARSSFIAAVRERDPLPAFAISERALDLAFQLLQWEPTRRIAAEDALAHPFFHAPSSAAQMGLVAASPGVRSFSSRGKASDASRQ
ncbi:hypothetical protein KFE25_009237 [Diacronema lutheri]|uniref:Protein kinase domain-containing protein n=1 Tax=Diacronema lutheri TaxID=2081491 RepID=A0A8J5XK87_DIALT|nr:hypothetical protein KFE25_009237 [Diacronema lutheri]